MEGSIQLRLQGVQAEIVAAKVAQRLQALGQAATHSKTMVTYTESCGETLELNVELEPNDAPDFAAEKVLDLLATKGLLELKDLWMSPEEETELRNRLKSLGYIE
ncbi:MAG TPA: hypothetical protein PLI09_25475 [Candidatus Hydrogenedentes bacterium]|nr:hypothetical protein [Candidatus Hydrogenedentota bacterium]